MSALGTTARSATARRGESAATPRRVLVLVDVYHAPYGGTEGQIRTLVRHLPAGWEVEVWALRPSAWFERGTFPCPTRVLDIGSFKSPRTWWRVRALARAIRRESFDVVHTYMNDASVLGPIAARWAGRPCLVSRRDLGFWQNPRWLALLRRSSRLAAGVITNCAAVARHTASAEHVPAGLVHVVHNGQSRAHFEPARDPELRARLGVPAEARVVGFLGNMKPIKRQDDLIAAATRLAERHPDLHVWFIGDEYDHSTPILERSLTRSIAPRVRVFRTEGDVASVLKHLEVGVLCSEQEGLSNAILEYLGCGLPVVASDVGGTSELVVEGENGFLYPAGDLDALTERLDRILSDPARARAMGAASRRRFEAHFTVERLVADTTAHYERLVETKPAGAVEDLRWEVLSDCESLEALADAWQQLLSPGQFFLGPDWVLSALREAPRGVRPHVLVARDGDGSLAGLLPLTRSRSGVLAVAGQSLGGDHVDVIARDGRADAVAQGALELLRGQSWRRLRLRHLAEDGALRRAVRRAGMPFRERLATVCPYLPSAGTFDDYVAGRPSKSMRRNIRRYVRRFVETEGVEVQRVRAEADMAAAVDRYYELHETRFRSRGEASAVSDALRPFHRRVATRAAASGRAQLTFLRWGGQDVACEYAFVHAGRMYAFQAGWDAEAGVTSPGLVLRALILRDDVFGEGRLDEYDFLDGDEAYKERWTEHARRLFDVEVHRPGWRGRAASFLAGGPRFLRQFLLGAGSLAGAPRA